MSEIKLGYTIILHGPRVKLGLTMNQYVVAAAIYHLSRSPKAAHQGWCNASRETLGAFFGLSRQTIISLLKELVEKKIIEVDPTTSHLKTTDIWFDEVECFEGQESLHPPVKNLYTPCKECLRGACKESLHNTNILNTDINTYSNNSLITIFLLNFNRITGKDARIVSNETGARIIKLFKSYTPDEIVGAITAATNDEYHVKTSLKYITPEFITRPDKFDKFLNDKSNGYTVGLFSKQNQQRNAHSGGKKNF